MDATYIIKFLNSVGAPDMAEEVAAMHNRLEAFSSRLDVAAMDCAIKAAEEAIKQRDKLLAALNLIEVDKDGDGFICREAMEQVREAIAHVEGADA